MMHKNKIKLRRIHNKKKLIKKIIITSFDDSTGTQDCERIQAVLPSPRQIANTSKKNFNMNLRIIFSSPHR
jgi:hypothetical protein